jgi:hypothetical protein
VALVWLVAMLAGCVGIPGNGPVVDARRVDAGHGGGFQLLPAGPTYGSSPGRLVRDFLRAAAAFTADHEVARSFLTPDARVTWRPDTPVIVYPGEDTLSVSATRQGATAAEPSAPATASGSTAPTTTTSTRPASGAASSAAASSAAASSAAASSDAVSGTPGPGDRAIVTVQVPVHARVNAAGQYVMSAPGDTEIRRFGLVGTEDGWRIDAVDNGILVTESDFGGTFQSLPVYFADSTGTYLVPDVRYFPVIGTTSTPSSLVSALLVGPVSWLRGGVVSGAPRDTRATVNAVRISNGVATVDLTEQARTADPRQRMMLKGQLEQTLFALSQANPPVTSVVVTVDQQRFELQAATGSSGDSRVAGDTTGELRSPPKTDPRPVVLDAKGRIARLVGRTAVPVADLPALPAVGLSAPATEASGSAYAVLTDNRTRLLYLVPSGAAVSLVLGHELLPPTFDPFGYVWTAQRDSGGVALAGRPGEGVIRVRAPWLAGTSVKALRISREGARAVLIVQRNGGAPEVYVSAVVRNRDGAPTELGAPMRLLVDAQDAASAAWVDATHVVVLARRPGSPDQPWIVEVGGDVHGTTTVQGVWVSAGNSESELYVQTAAGQVRARLGSGWTDVPGVRWPSFAG